MLQYTYKFMFVKYNNSLQLLQFYTYPNFLELAFNMTWLYNVSYP